MSKKSASSNGNIINADSQKYEIYEPNSNSLGRAVVAKLGFETGRVFIPIALEAIKKKLEVDQESQKLLRDDKREILNKRAENLISRIEN